MVAIDTAGLTWRELDELYPDLTFRELHDGALVVTPSPAWWHQDVGGRLYRAFAGWCAEHGGRAYVAPVDAIVSEHDVYQPDVWMLRTEHLDRRGDDGRLHGPPDVAVEVSSPSTRARDLRVKRDGYATFGVREYWFVDLDARAVLIFSLHDGVYLDPTIFNEGQTVHSTVLEGFAVEVAELLTDVP